MFLSGQDIQKHISEDKFKIDPPPDDNQWCAFGIELRLGTQFLRYQDEHSVAAIDLADPQYPPVQQGYSETIPFGESIAISPGSTVAAATLEYVHMPFDLGGFLLPRSAWERGGIAVSGGTIDPGFKGKLTLTLRNYNAVPMLLYPGLRVTRLCLFELTSAYSDVAPLGRFTPSAEIESVKETIQKTSPHRSASAPTDQSLSKRIAETVSADRTKKGPLLEELVADIFSSLEGLNVIQRNSRLDAEELDLVIRNDLDTGFWRLAGSPIIVECKNWSGKVGAREVSVLVDKLRTVGPDAKTGILVAVNGVTGDSYRDARLKIREARRDGRYILVLERADLEEIASGKSLAQVIERKYTEVILI